MDKALTFQIRSIGPLGSFRGTLPGPGLHLLMGPPESGKSTIERALTLAAKEGASKADAQRARLDVSWDAEAAPGRGLPEGQVMLPGIGGGIAGVNLRADGRVTRLPDPPAVSMLAGDQFIALTRHGLVAPDTARAAELRAFAEITGITAGPAALVPPERLEFFADIAEGPLAVVAEEVRKRGHALKGRALDDAAALERRVNVLRDAADKDAARAGAPTVAEAQAAQRRAEEDAARVRIDRRGRVRAEEERNQMRALHPAERPDPGAAQAWAANARTKLDALLSEAAEGLPPEPDVKEARDLATVALALANKVEADLVALRARIAELLRQEAVEAARLETLTAEASKAERNATSVEVAHGVWQGRAATHAERMAAIDEARREVETAEASATDAARRAETWDRQAALLASPVAGPTQADVDAAEVNADHARALVELAKRAEAEAARAAEEQRQTEAFRAAQALAEEYEGIATTGLRARIQGALEAASITGWGISDVGALTCADPARGGELVPFGSLSGSTKDAAAMGLILAHAGEAGPSRYLVMLLPQEVADGMIPEQLAGLAKLAQQRGVYIVGGKVAEGALRIVTVSP